MNADGANGAPPARYRLRLFVAGNTQHSQRAIENLHAICNRRLAGQIDLEIIDIYQPPELAESYRVVVAPTVIKLPPLPVRRIVGDLSEADRVPRDLDLMATPPASRHGC
ncbi:MAG: circadian clock KaiB family protein [Stellaceae bacterium]